MVINEFVDEVLDVFVREVGIFDERAYQLRAFSRIESKSRGKNGSAGLNGFWPGFPGFREVLARKGVSEGAQLASRPNRRALVQGRPAVRAPDRAYDKPCVIRRACSRAPTIVRAAADVRSRL